MRRHAFITGGSRGIGAAIARAFLRDGHEVIIGSRHREQMDELSQAEWVSFDAFGDVLKTVHVLAERPISILVNNVGGGGRWGSADPLETHPDVWQQVYQKNAGAAAHVTMALIPSMLQLGWGRVVTISSIHGRSAGGRPWFSMAKAAEIALMASCAQQRSWVRRGITFNTVCPGSVMIPDTGWDHLRREQPSQYETILDRLAMNRLGTPDEVASVVRFLCSDEASWVNGSTLVVDGGESGAW